jgi:hypothetical protein
MVDRLVGKGEAKIPPARHRQVKTVLKLRESIVKSGVEEEESVFSD